ncbi:MAG: RNA polymerase sigma factor [Clostridia bacterium]|nr:RNA polymerase sigma factor [Clostridia bacterium]
MIDADLIQRCQKEEEDAFDELYKVLGKKALWTAYLISGRRDVAEDILQEAFFECFRDIKKLRRPEVFPVWFNRILIRKCWHMVGKEKKTAADSLSDSMKEQVDSGIDITEVVEANEASRFVRNAIGRLKPEMRTVIILYYYNGLSIKEIAEVMKCFQGTVKSRLHYAKKELEKELKGSFGSGSFERVRYLGKECAIHE